MKEITPYLMFNGNCRDAMTFYQKIFGGELTISTYGETDPNTPPERKDQAIHAMLENKATMLLASDSHGPPITPGSDVWLSLNCDKPSEVDSVYAALVAGGTPNQPPHDAFWGSRFAMLTDRFGVRWMLSAQLA